MNVRRRFLGALMGLFGWLCDMSKAKAYRRQRFCVGIIRITPKMHRKRVVGFYLPGGRLPVGTEILGVSPHVWFHGNDWGLKVKHDSLPATPAGHPLPEVRPLFRPDGSFDRWGIVGKV